MCWVDKCFLKVMSFIKCLFQLLLYNPVKLVILCCIKLGMTIFMAFNSCRGIVIRVQQSHICHRSEHIQCINTVFSFITFTYQIYTIFETSAPYERHRCLKFAINCFQYQGFSDDVTHVTFMVTHFIQVFLAQKRNKPSCDIILLGIKAYISSTLIAINLLELPQLHSETFGLG